MKIFAPILMVLFMANPTWSQENRIRISGKVLDAKTKTPLSRATIEVKARAIELICNPDGEFQLGVSPDALNDSLEVSHLGYKTVKKRIADIKSPEVFMLEDHSIELRVVTVTSRGLALKDIDKSLRPIRGNLFAFETETTNGLYNLFLNYLEEQSQELYRACDYDLSGYDEKTIAFYKEYVSPYKRPVNKKDTTVKNYTDFPAVNISHGAAVIFCQWLTGQYNGNTGKKRFSKVKFRLPTLKEWQIAALGYRKFQTWEVEDNLLEVVIPEDTLDTLPRKGTIKTIRVGRDVLYPWYGAYYYRRKPQNHLGCFLGNFKVTHVERPCAMNRVAFDGWIKMAPTATYFPNDIGLYDVVGNVAEMIDEKGKACGGSWNDPPEASTIHSVKSYRKPDGAIGFRVFMEVVEE